MGDPATTESPQSGERHSPTMGLALERNRLSALGLSDTVVSTLQNGPPPQGRCTLTNGERSFLQRTSTSSASSAWACSTTPLPLEMRRSVLFVPRALRRRLDKFTCATSPDNMAEPSMALGAPPSPLLNLSLRPSQSIPCTQAQVPWSHTHSQSSTQSAKQAKHSRQAQYIMDLKNQMAQVLEYLARQQAQAPTQYISHRADLACTGGDPRCSRTGCTAEEDKDGF
ncbi:UNVERIFIED_CONTAM: hypothetical protein FKN15_071549 [Acipenser sinensis]